MAFSGSQVEATSLGRNPVTENEEVRTVGFILSDNQPISTIKEMGSPSDQHKFSEELFTKLSTKVDMLPSLITRGASPSSSDIEAISTGDSTQTPDPTSFPNSAKIALAVVVPSLVLIAIAAVYLYVRLRKRLSAIGMSLSNNDTTYRNSYGSRSTCAELDGVRSRQEMAQSMPPGELDGTHWKRELDAKSRKSGRSWTVDG